VRFSQPAICSGEQSNLSFAATARRSRELFANLQNLDDELAPKHLRPQAPLGSDHSRHCGPFPGSLSRMSGQATWRSIVLIDVS
jgi:hypothetical protein